MLQAPGSGEKYFQCGHRLGQDGSGFEHQRMALLRLQAAEQQRGRLQAEAKCRPRLAALGD